MPIAFKPDETFRDDFTFRNSPEAIRRFPFPFAEDAYMYSVNIEPHTAGPKGTCYEFPIDIDEHYIAECRERAICLETTPDRYLALPHMMPAQWDVLELITTSLARDYPEHFRLERDGTRWRWVNRPLGIEDEFTFGDAVDAAVRAARVHHPPGAGRLVRARPARRHPVDGRRHGDHPGGLVAQLRPRHELHRVARPGAAGATSWACSTARSSSS